MLNIIQALLCQCSNFSYLQFSIFWPQDTLIFLKIIEDPSANFHLCDISIYNYDIKS